MDVLVFIWDLVREWLWLFAAPVRDINVIWILIPIWISWFFTEFFQEKKGTHFGNAITNGAIPVWVAIDWSRYLTNFLVDKEPVTNVVLKFALCGLILVYGFFVIIEGLRAKAFVHIAGRIRVITYILVMFTPIIYGVVEFSWMLILSIIVMFPVFYFIIELIARITPDSLAFKKDEGDSDVSVNKSSQAPDSSFPPLDSNLSNSSDPFASPPPDENIFAEQPMPPEGVAPQTDPSFDQLPGFENENTPTDYPPENEPSPYTPPPDENQNNNQNNNPYP